MILDAVARLESRARLTLDRLFLRGPRHGKTLGDLADDAHLLADIGVTRDEALEEAGEPAFEVRNVYIHSL